MKHLFLKKFILMTVSFFILWGISSKSKADQDFNNRKPFAQYKGTVTFSGINWNDNIENVLIHLKGKGFDPCRNPRIHINSIENNWVFKKAKKDLYFLTLMNKPNQGSSYDIRKRLEKYPILGIYYCECRKKSQIWNKAYVYHSTVTHKPIYVKVGVKDLRKTIKMLDDKYGKHIKIQDLDESYSSKYASITMKKGIIEKEKYMLKWGNENNVLITSWKKIFDGPKYKNEPIGGEIYYVSVDNLIEIDTKVKELYAKLNKPTPKAKPTPAYKGMVTFAGINWNDKIDKVTQYLITKGFRLTRDCRIRGNEYYINPIDRYVIQRVKGSKEKWLFILSDEFTKRHSGRFFHIECKETPFPSICTVPMTFKIGSRIWRKMTVFFSKTTLKPLYIELYTEDLRKAVKILDDKYGKHNKTKKSDLKWGNNNSIISVDWNEWWDKPESPRVLRTDKVAAFYINVDNLKEVDAKIKKEYAKQKDLTKQKAKQDEKDL